MKREIKFRGLRIDGKGLVYGNLVSNGYFYPKTKQGIHYIFNTEEEVYDWEDYIYHEVITESIGQFTGLKDKNGVEIYEGDIIKYLGAAGLVVYESETAMYIIKFDSPMVNSYSFDSIQDTLGIFMNDIHEFNNLNILDMEVIGNIHENKK